MDIKTTWQDMRDSLTAIRGARDLQEAVSLATGTIRRVEAGLRRRVWSYVLTPQEGDPERRTVTGTLDEAIAIARGFESDTVALTRLEPQLLTRWDVIFSDSATPEKFLGEFAAVVADAMTAAAKRGQDVRVVSVSRTGEE